jgi:hypothetical protein
MLKLTTKIIFASVILFSNIVFAEQSPRQQQAVKLFENLRGFLRACLYSDQCPMNDWQLDITRKIIANDDRGYYTNASIIFKSGKQNPEAFESSAGETHRTMMTGNTPNSPILVNTDRIETTTPLLSVENVMALFAHELVHHLGYVDDAQRIPDQYGIFVSELLHTRISTQYFAEDTIEYVMISFPQPISSDGRKVFPKGIYPTVYIRTPTRILGANLALIASQGTDFCGGNEIWSAQGQFVGRQMVSQSGDNETYLLTFAMMARCYSAQEPALHEVNFKMDVEFEIDTRAKQFVNGSYSFQKTSVDPANEQSLTIGNVEHTGSVRAGTQFTITADVNSRWPLDVTGCGISIASPAWTGQAENLPFTVVSTSCRLLELGTNSAKMEATFDVPANAPDGLVLQPKMFGLIMRSTGQYRIGLPIQKTEIRVSGNGVPSTRLVAVVVVDSTGAAVVPSNGVYILSRKKSYYLGFQTEGVTTATDGFVTYAGLDATSSQVYKFSNLLHTDRGIKWVKGGFYYPIRMTESGRIELRSLNFLEMAFIDVNWNYISANLEAFTLKMQIQD